MPVQADLFYHFPDFAAIESFAPRHTEVGEPDFDCSLGAVNVHVARLVAFMAPEVKTAVSPAEHGCNFHHSLQRDIVMLPTVVVVRCFRQLAAFRYFHLKEPYQSRRPAITSCSSKSEFV
jgi:hypothetical protein